LKVNEYNFANHQHLDAARSNLLQGAWRSIPASTQVPPASTAARNCLNYYWRTIAHNALLVYDPKEVFSRKGDYGNDGGQRLPNGRAEPRALNVLLDPEKAIVRAE
jgi:heparin/heparan-sulfate lyase